MLVASKYKIRDVRAREILDSRGEPTIEVEIITSGGVFSASAPSGASRGGLEAKELRDGGERYFGKGVLKAVKKVLEVVKPKIKGLDATNQEKIDQILIEIDGTEDKSNLGSNTLFAVSVAVCKAGSFNIPVFRYIAEKFSFSPKIPKVCFNIINGGVHAGNELAFQEFMICPQNEVFSENLRDGVEIYQKLKEILKKKFGKTAINLGDEGGFAPPLSKIEDAIQIILECIFELKKENVKIALDCASNQFFKNGKYFVDQKEYEGESLLNFYKYLVEKYQIFSLEDPFSEEDWENWQKITQFGILIVGDDLLVSNKNRLKKAIDKKACNCCLIKINQIGTITEAVETIKMAKNAGFKIFCSHRSGETVDDFLADFAVGVGADFLKAGAPARGERVAKYNRLLKIEEIL
jgi:enolase